MRPTTRRLVSVSVLILAVSIVGGVLALAFQWPAQFDGQGDPNAGLGEFIFSGTATSPPVIPVMVLLVLFILLAPSQRWWGTVSVVGLCLLAVLMFIASLGEAFAPPTPYVPRAVLVTSGVVGALLAVTLLLSGIIELVDRRRVS